MKNLLDCNRLNVHGQKTMKGRLFVNFIALIILNELRSRVSAIKLKERNYWDLRDMLNKVATYARIHFAGIYKDLWTVPIKAQRTIFDLLGIEYFWKMLYAFSSSIVAVSVETSMTFPGQYLK
jgi:hypothetical protein